MQKNKITRRDFISRTAAGGFWLTMPSLLENCSPPGSRLDGPSGDDPAANAEALGLGTPILKSLNTGITAPNAHNTQAWKFYILNDLEMQLYVDETRILPQTDPTTRQIHISQGALLEHLTLGAGSYGYNAQIKLFPDGEYQISETGKKPVAHVKLEKLAGPQRDTLFAAVQKRTTVRAPYEGGILGDDTLQRLRELMGSGYSELGFVNDRRQMSKWSAMLDRAFALEINSRPKNEESRVWFRFDDNDIFTKRDGISLRGNGLSGMKLFIAKNFFISADPESFHSEANRKAGADIFRENLLSSGAFACLKTKTNTQTDWVRAGFDYARLHLAAAHLDLAMQPMSQILQEYPEMSELRLEFEKHAGVSGNEKIQMLVRLGRCDYRFFAPRRPLQSMIRTKETT